MYIVFTMISYAQAIGGLHWGNVGTGCLSGAQPSTPRTKEKDILVRVGREGGIAPCIMHLDYGEGRARKIRDHNMFNVYINCNYKMWTSKSHIELC